MKCPNCGCEVVRRSTSQNALYWLWIGALSAWSGNTPASLHKFFKDLFISPTFEKVFGEEIEVRKSTTDLSKEEFMEYLNRIQAYCVEELNFILPIPEDKKLQSLIKEIEHYAK